MPSPQVSSDLSQKPGSVSKKVRVMTWRGDKLARDRIKVAMETPLTILLNHQEVVTLLCIQDAPSFLAVGFLFSEGLIRKAEDIRSILEDPAKGRVTVIADQVYQPAGGFEKRTVTTGCGKGSTFTYALGELKMGPFPPYPKLSPDTLFKLMKELTLRSHLYKETRGTHNSALASPEGIEVFYSDVGRHNAVDKINGQCILENRPSQGKLLVTTGRITSEIVIKCARMGIHALISRHAATSLAVELANQFNMTLVGALRGSRFTVYAGFDRVVFP